MTSNYPQICPLSVRKSALISSTFIVSPESNSDNETVPALIKYLAVFVYFSSFTTKFLADGTLLEKYGLT